MNYIYEKRTIFVFHILCFILYFVNGCKGLSNKMKKKNNQSYYTNRHSCFLLSYHLVLVTKYRKPVLKDKIKETVYDTIKTILEEKGIILISINGEEDHVHILFEASPDIQLVSLINIIKTKTARFARRDNKELLSKYFYKPYFWTDSYFITTVGENTKDIIKTYIDNQ